MGGEHFQIGSGRKQNTAIDAHGILVFEKIFIAPARIGQVLMDIDYFFLWPTGSQQTR